MSNYTKQSHFNLKALWPLSMYAKKGLGYPKDFLFWKNFSKQQIEEIMKLALEVKAHPRRFSKALKGEKLVMLFQKTSTRTRVSFEASILELGGHAIYLDWGDTNFHLTKIEYEAHCLSQYAKFILVRLKEHKHVLEFANASKTSVINGCCNRYHPCQAMADFLTMYESNGYTFKGLRLAYVGVHNNVANSLVELASAFGIHLTLVCPVAKPEIVDEEGKSRLRNINLLEESLELKKVVKEVNFVYTDTWVDMEYFNNPEFESINKENIEKMLPYQINAKLLENLNVKVLHDMPIHSEYEISDDLVYDSRSIIFQQAMNRLYVQKAMLLFAYWGQRHSS